MRDWRCLTPAWHAVESVLRTEKNRQWSVESPIDQQKDSHRLNTHGTSKIGWSGEIGTGQPMPWELMASHP